MHIPSLETARLRLAPPEAHHFEAYAALVADAELMKHLEQPPQDRTTAYRAFCAMLGHWFLRGVGSWMVEERDTGRVVGRVGHIEWDGWPELELGWWIARDSWGRGYAPEAARAVLEHSWRDLKKTRLVSFIRPANLQSVRVAEKLGAVHEKDIPFLGSTSRVYVHTPRSATSTSLQSA
jgi:RimJ/RimL family protein N-acetyltransferase